MKMKKVMSKPEYLELGQEALEELRLEAVERFEEEHPDKPIPEYLNKKVTKISIERALRAVEEVIYCISQNLEIGEKAEVMGLKIERVPVKAREGVMERPNGERIPFRTEEGSKVVVKALKALKDI